MAAAVPYLPCQLTLDIVDIVVPTARVGAPEFVHEAVMAAMTKELLVTGQRCRSIGIVQCGQLTQFTTLGRTAPIPSFPL